MFTAKKDSLFERKTTSANTSGNSFVAEATKKAAKTRSGNGALKYSTTGNDFVDQFGKLGSMKEERKFADISSDMSVLWAKNPRLAVCFIFFIRMITRVVSLFDGLKTKSPQRGAGLKHEGIMRMLWLHINHPDVFWNNIQLYVSISSWRDIFEMLRYDLQYNGWKDRQLNWDKFRALILAGLENPNTSELVKKYMPAIKAKSACTTIETQANTLIGKWLSNAIFGKENYKEYRKLKSSGKAHKWQQLISKQLYKELDFNSVHGRALALMVSSKFIENQGLTARYEEWIANKPVAKFTGFVNELFAKAPAKKYQIDTLNAQFNGLVETAKKGATLSTGMIVVRDTSGSMGSTAPGTKQSCYDIGKALALFFSYMLPKGTFADSWIEFNSDAKMHLWKGSTPWEKWCNDHTSFVGSTDFQSVINLFVSIKRKGISESEFPTGIICISDSEFNPTMLGKTNVDAALHTLRAAGFSEAYVANFKIVLWNLQHRGYANGAGNKFETYGNVKNVYYFSGYEASIIAFLTGIEGKEAKAPETAEELFEAAMDQEIMSMIKI